MKAFLLGKVVVTREMILAMLRLKVDEFSRSQGWNMRELAELLKVDHQTVLYWNQGRAYPRLPMMVRLSQVFNCSLHDLLDL